MTTKDTEGKADKTRSGPATGSPTRFSPEVVRAALELEQNGFDEFCHAGAINAIRRVGETEESCALRVVADELRRVQAENEWLTCLAETIRDKGDIRMGKERGIMAWAALRDLAKRRLALRRESENRGFSNAAGYQPQQPESRSDG